jgi:hypothetical protein
MESGIKKIKARRRTGVKIRKKIRYKGNMNVL